MSTLAPHCNGTKERDLDKTEIDKMLHRNVVRPAYSEWTSLIVFYPKKDSSLRLCTIYREMNALGVKDAYSISQMDVCLDLLGDMRIF